MEEENLIAMVVCTVIAFVLPFRVYCDELSATGVSFTQNKLTAFGQSISAAGLVA